MPRGLESCKLPGVARAPEGEGQPTYASNEKGSEVADFTPAVLARKSFNYKFRV